MKNPTAEAMVSSLQNWWSIAGVEWDYAEEPSSLLSREVVSLSQKSEPQIAATEPAPEIKKPAIQNEKLPGEYPEFVAWLADSTSLIEANWSKNRVMPQGALQPEVMVISALPEKSRHGDTQLFNSGNQKLLNKMLAAIGCDSEQSYLSTISVSASVDGRIDEQHWPTLKTRLIHHIGLVRPRRIICFGDLAAKIIFGEDLLSARKNIQFINHSSSKTEAIVTFHPRILIERPLFKAEAWKDLQMLTRISAL
ncbi:MAG: uracil-DNA glycosylase family protein [Sphingorhabdus sp.]